MAFVFKESIAKYFLDPRIGNIYRNNFELVNRTYLSTMETLAFALVRSI